ncbi:protein Yae1p [Trichomonascus vanleenenianus]|uniref:Yae1p n=1 Tax=Trichomonascus vanleenenianus TaxID=2268995 RepID=UPI003ECBAA31
MSTEVHGFYNPEVVPIDRSKIKVDDDEDIWASSDDEQHNTISQTVAIKRQHHKAGYVDGVTASKDDALQKGFDSGYPVGAKIGLAVGQILGRLQGLGLVDLMNQAAEELEMEKLFNAMYWDDEVNKKWDGEIHPVVLKWQQKIGQLE